MAHDCGVDLYFPVIVNPFGTLWIRFMPLCWEHRSISVVACVRNETVERNRSKEHIIPVILKLVQTITAANKHFLKKPKKPGGLSFSWCEYYLLPNNHILQKQGSLWALLWQEESNQVFKPLKNSTYTKLIQNPEIKPATCFCCHSTYFWIFCSSICPLEQWREVEFILKTKERVLLKQGRPCTFLCLWK